MLVRQVAYADESANAPSVGGYDRLAQVGSHVEDRERRDLDRVRVVSEAIAELLNAKS